ncbi:MAG: tRNA lysidine(34) synthetase TilS [Pseudomonadota bacterium]
MSVKSGDLSSDDLLAPLINALQGALSTGMNGIRFVDPKQGEIGFERRALNDCGGSIKRSFEDEPCVVLAVSGGADSLSLLLAAGRLVSNDFPIKFRIATVDHGLRPESRSEATYVAQIAKDFGFQHSILCWNEGKPISGIQASARSARYRLLAEEARRVGACAILTGHTASDVSETFLMRASRGAGTRGLAAIADHRFIASGADRPISLLRPFLSFDRAYLSEAVMKAGLSPVKDPSNDNPEFERPRVRAFLNNNQKTSFPLKSRFLADTSHRLRKDTQKLNAFEEYRFKLHGGHFSYWGGICCEAANWDLDLDTGLTARILRAVGAGDFRPDETAAGIAVKKVLDGKRASLAGALIECKDDKLWFFREPSGVLGRAGTPELRPLEISSARPVLFDKRLIINVKEEFLPQGSDVLTVRPIRHSEAASFNIAFGPSGAVPGMPAIFKGAALIDCLANGPSPVFQSLVQERFEEKTIRF